LDLGLVMRSGDDLVLSKEVWRRPLERLSCGLVFKRRLPAAFDRHPIFVTPACTLKVLKFWLNPFVDDLLYAVGALVAEGETIWDVGANMGVFSVAAAARAKTGNVLAFEPDPWIAGMFRRTAALAENSRLQIEIVAAAVSDTDGIGWLNVNSRSRHMNNLRNKSIWSDSRSQKAVVPIATLRLDTIMASEHVRPPHLIKVDIEGAEHVLLRGAHRVLAEARPVWFMEVASENADEVSSIFRAHGYRVFDGDALSQGLIERGVYDWLAIPDNKIDTYTRRVEAAQAAHVGAR
jgi:FkbM family methyltransferase